PQHLLVRAARGFSVVFMEEPVFADEPAPRLDVSERPGGVRVAVPVLPHGMGEAEIVAAQERLLRSLLATAGADFTVFWYYTPMALAFSRAMAPDIVVYDNMDELSAFLGAPQALLDMERELMARADLVFTGGVSIFEAKQGRHSDIHPFPSSIDVHHFAGARQGLADPADQAGIPRPRLGFFGVIDERMDVDLLGEVADLRPDWQFVMLGPVVKIDPASLPRRPNIHWLGGKSYPELPAYLANWDLGLMPFAINEATRFISPTKTPEFLAAGLPVISTPIRDVIRPYGDLGLVEIAATAGEIVARADALLAAPAGDLAPDWLARVDRQLATTSWDRTWREMQRQIERVRTTKIDASSAAPARSVAARPPVPNRAREMERQAVDV
ncbi:Glycosyl transferases group 1, partial [Faunimonas pinastri]